MAFGFAKALSETLTLRISTVRPRSTGAEAGLTGQRVASADCLVGELNGLAVDPNVFRPQSQGLPRFVESNGR